MTFFAREVREMKSQQTAALVIIRHAVMMCEVNTAVDTASSRKARDLF